MIKNNYFELIFIIIFLPLSSRPIIARKLAVLSKAGLNKETFEMDDSFRVKVNVKY